MKKITIIATMLAGINAGYSEYSETKSAPVDNSCGVEESSIKEVIKQEIPYASEEQLEKIEEKLLPEEVKISSGAVEPQSYNDKALIIQYPDGPDGIELECDQEFLKQARKVIEIVQSGAKIPYIIIEIPKDAGALHTNLLLTFFRNLASEGQNSIPFIIRVVDHYSSYEEYISKTDNSIQKSSTSVSIDPNSYEKMYYNEQYSSDPREIKDYSQTAR